MKYGRLNVRLNDEQSKAIALLAADVQLSPEEWVRWIIHYGSTHRDTFRAIYEQERNRRTLDES